MAKFTSGRSLTIMAFNADRIMGQVHELEKILYERNIDILLLNETRLKTKDKFKIQNYYTYRDDRKDAPKGGTVICVRKEIGHRLATIPNLQFIEITGIFVPTSTNKEMFIGSVY